MDNKKATSPTRLLFLGSADKERGLPNQWLQVNYTTNLENVKNKKARGFLPLLP